MGSSEGPAPRSRRARGALEQDVLTCLAAADRGMTAADVLGELGAGLAYTTVMTTLSRLHEKGLLSREPSGRAYAYRLVGDHHAVRTVTIAHKMRRLLEAGDDRAGVLAHFVADLAPEDEQLLTSLLRSADPLDRHRGSSDAGPHTESD